MVADPEGLARRSVVSLIALLACAADPPADPPAPPVDCDPGDTGYWDLDPLCCVGVPTLALTGVDPETRAATEPLADGADLEMLFGPAGGWTLALGLRTVGLPPALQVSGRARDDTGRVVADSEPVWLLLARDDGCGATSTDAFRLYFLWELDPLPPEQLCGAPLTVEVEVVDDDGRAATRTLSVTVQPDCPTAASFECARPPHLPACPS